MELFSLLFGLACTLVAVAVIGHGLWVLGALILGGGGQPSGGGNLGRGPGASCPRCGLPLEADRCAACDWPTPPASARRRPHAALTALEKQVERLNHLAVIDPPAYQKFSNLFVEEHARLTAMGRAQQVTTEAAPAHATASPAPPQPAPKKFTAPPIPVPKPLGAPAADEALAAIAAAASLEQAVPAAASPIAPPADALAPHAPLSERAARFEARQAHLPPTIAAPPLPPARSWTDWLAAFMEERNMRWGELVGGLLIVSCSIALVISFWSAIAERPWLKFFLFNGVTAALFGVGFYSEHRWRLRTTSRGLLTIGTLLVPLNFLAIAAFSSPTDGHAAVTIGGELISTVLFTALVFGAAQILIDAAPLWLVAGVLIPSLAQLLARRFVDPAADFGVLAGMAALPLAVYLAVNAWVIRRANAVLVPAEREVNALLEFVGLTSFAAFLSLVLVMFKTERPLETLRELPFVPALFGLVPLGLGLLLWQKLAGRERSALRTAGTSVAMLGAVISLSGLVLGWPEPRAMFPSAVCEFVVFTFVAWQFKLPAAHLLAAACLAIAYLLGVNLADHQLAWSGQGPHDVVAALVSGRTGTLLAPLVVAYGGAAFFALRRSRATGIYLGVAGAALAAISVVLLGWFDFGVEGDPVGSGWIFLLYAAGCLAVATRVRLLAVPWIGSALLLAGVVEIVVFRYGAVLELVDPEISAILIAVTIAALVALVIRGTGWAIDESPAETVLWNAPLVGSIVAGLWLFYAIGPDSTALEAGHWPWLAIIWAVMAWITYWSPVWTLAQVALCLSVVFGVVLRLEHQTWFVESPRPWLDPWTLEALSVALAGLNLAWIAVRLAFNRACQGRDPESKWCEFRDLLASPWLSVDRVTSGALVALVIGLGAYAVVPGVLQELTPRALTAPNGVNLAVAVEAARVVPPIEQFEWLGIPHQHAAQWGCWLLWGAMLVLVAATARERSSPAWLWALLAVATVCGALVASRWEDEVAVASALRWLSVATLVVGSVAIWCRAALARFATGSGWQLSRWNAETLLIARAVVFTLGLAPLVAIMATIGFAALARAPAAGQMWGNSLPFLIVAGCSIVAASGLWSMPEQARKLLTTGDRPIWPQVMSALALVLGLAPIVSVILYHVGAALVESPIVGPEPTSIFARMGLAGSYATPILITAAVLVGYALRERSSAFALAGSLLLGAGATAGYLLTLANTGLQFDAAVWIRLAEINAALAAGYALAWVATITQVARAAPSPREPLAVDAPLATQVAMGPALLALVLGWAWWALFWQPLGPGVGVSVMQPELADAWGWGCLALVAISVWIVVRLADRRVSLLGVSALGVALVIDAATIASRWDTGNWLAFHTLLVGHCVVATALVAWVWRLRRPAAGGSLGTMASVHWIDLQMALIFVLSIRALAHNGWWSAGGVGFLGVLLAPAMAWLFQRRRYLYAAGVLVNLAGLFAANEINIFNGFHDFVYLNVIFLAVPVPVWMWIEKRRIAVRDFNVDSKVVPFHRVAARLAAVALTVLVAAALAGDAVQIHLLTPTEGMHWVALAATAIAVGACLWDAAAKDVVAGLYLVGLVACGVLVDECAVRYDLTATWVLWLSLMVTAAYALATSYLWSRRAGLSAAAAQIGIPPRQLSDLAALAWLVPCNLLLVAAVVAMTVAVELTSHNVSMRVLAAQATLVQVASVALLARGDRRGVLQTVALELGAAGAVLFALAWLKIGTTLTLINAIVSLSAALAAVSALYGFGLNKLLRETSDWLAPARRLTPWLATVSAAAILVALGEEVLQYAEQGHVAIAPAAITVIALTLIGAVVAALAAALLPGRDPLSLSERGRTLYVYAAEIALALLFVHIRLTLPWLFTGFFQQYWPLVIMAIAFTGVAFGEFCRRRRQYVLAEPIQNTGALLPALPVIGFWASDAHVDYSLLLLSVGVLYAGLSIARRSFGFGVLAALAANGGLWYFLDRQQGLEFLAHPQVWLIPPAVCVLVAAYMNRSQLSDAQMTAVRYGTSMTIYLASTGDIFLNGVAQQPWLPLVLAGLSVLGILAGMILRVRAFLFLGTGFLVLSLFTIIYYAAVDLEQTWIWAASGIVLGVLILALFAMFEKKRQDFLEMLDRLKQWDA